MTELSPGYVALVERLVVLIEQWCMSEPALADLRWHQPEDGVVISGPLEGRAIDFLAASPDARRLCEWLDEQTGHQATLLQVQCALGMLGHLPMPKHVMLERRLTTTDVTPAACPDCGQTIERATHDGEARPTPGDLCFCLHCGAFLVFDERLEIQLLGAEAFARLHEDNQKVLLAMKHQHRKAKA